MISEKSKEMNVYEYFNYCKIHKGTRGVAVITDKQYLFYSQVEKDDYKTHDNIYVEIENNFHPSSASSDWSALRQNDAYAASLGRELIIFLPANKQLSMSQYFFICDILDQIIKFNNEQTENNRICLYVAGAKEISEDIQTDLEKLKELLYKSVTKDININEEKIIGKTLDKETIIKNIKYHIDIESVKNIFELKSFLIRCMQYHNDTYYKDIFYSVFKDFKKVKELMPIFYICHLENEILENVTLDNVLNLMINKLDKLFYHNDLETIKMNISNFKNLSDSLKNDINSIYPNFIDFINYIDQIDISDDYQKEIYNTMYKSTKGYSEVFSITVKLIYSQNLKLIDEYENQIAYYNKALENVMFKNNIIKDKDKILNLIAEYKVLKELLIESENFINEHNLVINQNKESIDARENDIASLSSNVVKKIFNRKNINNNKLQISASNSVIIDRKNMIEKLYLKIETIKKEMEQIEEKFAVSYGLSKVPDNETFINIIIEEKELSKEEILTRITDFKKKKELLNDNNLYLKEHYQIDDTLIYENYSSVHK